jgi:hypothetical protein
VFRFRFWKLAVLGWSLTQPRFSMAGPPTPGEPARLPLPVSAPSTNQQIAENIARNLDQSGQLRRYVIDVTFQDGVVELSGTVADQSQREETVRLVQGMSGVVVVKDRLTFGGAVTQAQAADAPPRLPAPLPGPAQPGPGLSAAPGNGAPEPQPIFQAPMTGPYDLNPPKMPPYAWPTYAPYNNFSRVACPESYPYQAWPFIGPNYPFPKIPPGWRSVKLEWDDGHWWYSSHSTPKDSWRLRFW